MSRYLVVGTGVSGIAAVQLLCDNGQDVIVFDGNENLDVCCMKLKHPALEEVPVYLGTLPDEVYDDFDIAILSPGVPTDSPMVLEMKKQGKTIWGEIELAYRMGHGSVVGITGTNGKTTTTALTGVIMQQHFDDVKVVGNIGIPYTQVVSETKDDTVVVAEISSFQLETIDTFAPKVSAILNITPDHLNRHHTMDAYIEAKESITKNQKESDVCVLNYEDSALRLFGKTLKCKVIWFSSTQKLEEGLFYSANDRAIYWARDGKNTKIIGVDELNIVGLHNYENAMAAIAMADAMGVELEEIRAGLRKFTAVEHRIEYVCTKQGVKYYNDSKGTNPDAAIKGICAMDRPTCLIGGGYDKQSNYDEWVEKFAGRVKKLVLIGDTRYKIAKCCKKYGFEEFVFADSLEEAVAICANVADSGDAVLLSPACASWDMFRNYEERGRLFKEYVNKLAD